MILIIIILEKIYKVHRILNMQIDGKFLQQTEDCCTNDQQDQVSKHCLSLIIYTIERKKNAKLNS